jgi:hypothetical protein
MSDVTGDTGVTWVKSSMIHKIAEIPFTCARDMERPARGREAQVMVEQGVVVF